MQVHESACWSPLKPAGVSPRVETGSLPLGKCSWKGWSGGAEAAEKLRPLGMSGSSAADGDDSCLPLGPATD